MAEYIEREAVLDILASKNAPWDAYVKVSQLRFADVVPVVHGKWVYDENGMDWNIPAWRCSECDAVHPALPTFCGKEKLHLFVGSKFCPNCGARMDG